MYLHSFMFVSSDPEASNFKSFGCQAMQFTSWVWALKIK